MLAKRVGCLAANFHTIVYGQRILRFDRYDAVVDLDSGAIAGDFLDRLLDRRGIALVQLHSLGVEGPRHLSQREAAFERTALYKAALDFGLPATIADIERRTRALVRSGDLIAGKGDHRGWLASRDAVLTEQRIMSEVAAGKGASSSAVEPGSATDRVQTAAMAGQGFCLNEGQLGAAKLILTSEDRTIAVQGIAGAGKSSVLKPVAEVLRDEGHSVIGLAIQNTLVQMVERDTGIGSQTLARFLGGWKKLLDDPGNAALRAEAAASFDLSPDAPTLLVFGGSLGALRLNTAIAGSWRDVLDAGWQLLHVTGDRSDLEDPGEPGYALRRYVDRMDLAFAACDFIVSRSGAATVSEISALGIPAVYVPYAVGNGEQALNAASAVAHGAAILIPDADFTPGTVRDRILPLLTDADERAGMAEKAAEIGIRTGTENLIAMIDEALA